MLVYSSLASPNSWREQPPEASQLVAEGDGFASLD